MGNNNKKNKLKPTMDYWQHSTTLAETVEMKKLIFNFGALGYATYIYLMEKIGHKIYEDLKLDEDLIQIISKTLKTTPQKIRNIIDFSVKIKLFNEKKYNKKLLSNDFIEANKKQVIEERKKDRSRKTLEPLEENKSLFPDGTHTESVGHPFKRKEKNSKEENSKESKEENSSIIIVINGTTITTKIELYNIISSLLNIKELNQAQINLIDKMYNENSTALSKAIENCQISANGTINMNYLSKAYETAKTQNLENLEPNSAIQEAKEDIQSNIDEAEELEKLKEARKLRKASADSKATTNEDINEAEDLEYQELKRQIKEKHEKEKARFYE